VRHARAGLVNGLHVGLLLKLLLALLGDIELAEQLSEQLKMPNQRGAQGQLGENAQVDFLVGEFNGVLGNLSEIARFSRRVPEAARHPGQAREADAGLLHETLGLVSSCDSSAKKYSQRSNGRPIDSR